MKEIIIDKIEKYFASKAGRQTPNNDQTCNALGISDNRLADIVRLVTTQMDNGKIPKYFHLISNGGDNAKLRKTCCDCVTSGVTWGEKNIVRNQAEKELAAVLQKIKGTATVQPPNQQQATEPQTEIEQPVMYVRKIKVKYIN
jgi:hypothetical protein